MVLVPCKFFTVEVLNTRVGGGATMEVIVQRQLDEYHNLTTIELLSEVSFIARGVVVTVGPLMCIPQYDMPSS